MKFSTVAGIARQLVTRGHGAAVKLRGDRKESPDLEDSLGDVVYGRVCTTEGGDPPEMLSSDPSRKSVFLFGPDAVEAIIIKQAAYNILCSIGRDKDYLYHMV